MWVLEGHRHLLRHRPCHGRLGAWGQKRPLRRIHGALRRARDSRGLFSQIPAPNAVPRRQTGSLPCAEGGSRAQRTQEAAHRLSAEAHGRGGLAPASPKACTVSPNALPL